VCILIRRPGVPQQPTIIRTRDGATVFQSVSYCSKFNLGEGLSFRIGTNLGVRSSPIPPLKDSILK